MTTATKKEPEDIFSGLDQAASPSAGASIPVAPRAGFPWKLIIILVVALLVVAGVGYVAWSYFVSAKPEAVPVTQTPIAPTPKPVEQIEQPPVVETPPPAPVTQPPAGATIPTPVIPALTIAPTEGIDTDGDALTDAEEPYYGADLAQADTDGDGYPDGSEVKSLFSPAAKGALLASAAFIAQLAWGGWSFLAPEPWSVVPDIVDPNRASLTTGTAGRFVLERLVNAEKESLDTWLSRQQLSAPIPFKTKGGADARQTPDGLTTYVAADDSVLRVTYDLNGEPTFEYRTSYTMFLHSLKAPEKK